MIDQSKTVISFYWPDWKGIGKSISTGAQYVTLESKIYSKNIKMCRFSSGNWFFCTKFVQLAVGGERRNTFVHLQRSVINWT
jgi:hypothetical protein